MELSATRYGDLVRQHGLSPTHQQVIDWVQRSSRVLEVGCAGGYVGHVLIEAKGCSVTGLEIDPDAAQEARANGLSVLEGSLEDDAFVASIDDQFDCVIAADVIEHMRDPDKVLETFKRWLRPGGYCIIAVPNVATWEIRSDLFFRGSFEYQQTGILDRTHLHMFTWETLHDMLRRQGWAIEETMIDGYDIPFGNLLLRTVPEWMSKRVTAPLDDGGAPLGLLRDQARVGLNRIHALRDRIGNHLAHRFPNLCARHVAVLLRLP